MVRRILAAMAPIVLASCGDAPRDCNAEGSASSVSVEVGPSVDIVRLCIDDVCDPSNEVFVPDEPDTYGYELTVVIDGDERIIGGEVETREFRVNGPGCDPVTANAVLRVSADRSVTVEEPR
ncbi:MAG: hypothetical protein AAF480_06360 [Actinomycetota bacterium]